MRFLLMIFAVVWWGNSAAAQDRDAVEGVIGQQLQAFNDRDVAGAWVFAGPNIQRMFGNATNFGAMVQQGYPMVWDNSNVQFLEFRGESGIAVQRVLIEDAQGLRHVLDYMMVETPTGWRIAGVSLVPAPDVGA